MIPIRLPGADKQRFHNKLDFSIIKPVFEIVMVLLPIGWEKLMPHFISLESWALESRQ